uniref:Uncharacterized protein n=1 Tax=Romanomermis culicivorax TaxID=13658 RepID=A0A915JTQ5_ROMCU
MTKTGSPNIHLLTGLSAGYAPPGANRQDLRRGSFIYKTELKPESYSSKSSFSRGASISSSDIQSKLDEAAVVTPFARILTDLHN